MSERVISVILAALREEMPQLSDAGLRAARALLHTVSGDLQTWTTQVAMGHLTPEEVQWLAASRMDVVRMQALKESGLSLVQFDALRRRLTVHIVSSLIPGPGAP